MKEFEGIAFNIILKYDFRPYQKHNEEFKREAIRMVKEKLIEPNKAAKLLNIHTKSLKRWIKYGPERKKGMNLIN